jgi:cell division protein FtsI/penicillin-binding protein 2
MPASIVKPVMAAAFLSNATVGARWLAGERDAMRAATPPAADSLRGQLMRSNSARFLDRMFCADRGFSPCARPWEIQAQAGAFGWNGGCASPGERCGAHDLMFGRPVAAVGSTDDVEAPAAWVSFGRLMVEPAGGKSASATFRNRAPVALDASKLKRCAEGADGVRASGDDWEKCRGGMIVDVVAEGWGQGHARSTALGAAGMMAALASAANGQQELRKPHLVRAVRGIASATPAPVESAAARWAAASVERNNLGKDVAEVILSGLSYSHRHGTARRACEQVFDARTCRDIDWIAGKTGTPTFPNDERSLDELAWLCAPATRRTRAEESACGGLRPYKWYVAAWRTDPSSPAWTKVIGVLTERNWLADSGRIHGAGDHGPNPAAEIAFQIVGRRMGLLVEDVR